MKNISNFVGFNLWKIIVRVGYCFSSWLIALQISFSRNECCIRLDLIFFGLYVGYCREGK